MMAKPTKKKKRIKERNAVGMRENSAATATPAALPPRFNGCLATAAAAAIMDVKESVLAARSPSLARANGHSAFIFQGGHAALLATHLRRRQL